MDVESDLIAGRHVAELLMVDGCAVARTDDAREVTDPVTGEVTFVGSPVYAGKCKVQTADVQEANTDSGGRVITTQRYQLHLPVTAGPVRVGDLVEVTAATYAPQLAGRTYRVVATHHKSFATAQRLEITEVTG